MLVKKLPKSCKRAADVVVTQEMLDQEAGRYKKVGYTQTLLEQQIVDGKHVALVAVSNDAMKKAGNPPAPHLMCACDMYREERPDGSLYKMGTFSCERKKAWSKERMCVVASEYADKNMSAEDIFMDAFLRVQQGEWLGQSQGEMLYLQEAAEIAGVSDGSAVAGWDVGARLVKQKKISLDGAAMYPYRAPPRDTPNGERTPLSLGEDEGPSDHPMIVWHSLLDKRFHCEVQRLHADGHRAVLCIFDKDAQNRLLAFAEVGLAYGARFGPDVGDADLWQMALLQFIDCHIYNKTVVPDARFPAFTRV